MSVLMRLFGGQRVSVVPTSLAYYYEAAEDHRAFYDLLRAYYLSNGLYDELRSALAVTGAEDEALKPLRNPAARVVEFYAAKLWPGKLPGALPIETENPPIVAPIERVWEWSNWGAQKQVAARWMPLYGDLFKKVASRPGPSTGSGQVFFQLIDPRYVPDFDADERGFLTWFRADIPQEQRVEGEVVSQTYTEVWDKAAGTYRVWEHEEGYDADLKSLGKPKTEKKMEEFGIDFVPVVHVRQKDIGDERGDGAFAHAIDKIDEANRMATRLHQMLFRHNRNVWALEANMVDKTGRPVPAPVIGTAGSDTLELGDNSVVRLPGNSKLSSMVPDLKYDQALAILNAHLLELERDLPELAYGRLRERAGELSGRAVRLLLSNAIDRVVEARGNAETGLARADAMALTIGQGMRLEGFGKEQIGTYEAGAFEHSFKERDVIPLDEGERAEVFARYVQGGLPTRTALRRAGWNDEQIGQAELDRQAELSQAQSSLASALLEQQRRFDQGA